MRLPDLYHVKQHFEVTREPDVASAVRRELSRLELGARIRPGDSVALTAGSRGIANIALILREAVAFLRSLQARPYLVPAMGSHGGATADGQTRLLHSYGITEEFVAAPIRASMDVAEIGCTEHGVPVVLDRLALEADHIGVVARVKPHTAYSAKIESGLCKMMMIGLGKHAGAQVYHQRLLRHEWEPLLRSVVKVILSKARISFGLAIVENALDETALVRGSSTDAILATDEELLRIARKWMPRLPFTDGDVLVIDEIGKDVSGSGMDTNVVGRKRQQADGGDGQPRFSRIVVLRLTPRTHGNATGIGLADFTTDRVVGAMDYRATIVNCLTASRPEGAAIPIHFPTDREAIETAVLTSGVADSASARIQIVRNTLDVAELFVSTTYNLTLTDTPLDVIERIPFPYSADNQLAAKWTCGVS